MSVKISLMKLNKINALWKTSFDCKPIISFLSHSLVLNVQKKNNPQFHTHATTAI